MADTDWAAVIGVIVSVVAALVAVAVQLFMRRRQWHETAAYILPVSKGGLVNEAQLVIALVSAILQGIDVWFKYQDRRAAREAANAAFASTLANPATAARSAHLLAIIPADTIERMRQHLQRCYKKLNEMLDNEDSYFPEDINKAGERALPRCVCEALQLIKNVCGDEFPDETLSEAWTKYRCSARLSAGPAA